MSDFKVFLEVHQPGICTAHVLDLPGCFAQGHSRDQALAAVPAAIYRYGKRMMQNGERSPTAGLSFGVEIVGESSESVRDTLFAMDDRTVGREEIERHLQLAAYQRAELWSIWRQVPAWLRRWRGAPDHMTIEEVVHHIGRSERWYVTRLLAPNQIPGELAGGAEKPLKPFLTTVRQAAVNRLRNLSDKQLGQVLMAAHNTHFPDEPWTVAKVLRRLLEHEREHIDHILEILGNWRGQLRARMAAERAHLLRQLYGLDAETLSQRPVVANWTARDLLVHVGSWDALYAGRMGLASDGRAGEIEAVFEGNAIDTYNEALRRQAEDASLASALEDALKGRADVLSVLDRVPETMFHRQIRLSWGWRTSIRTWTRWRYLHDAEHAADLARWRKELPPEISRAYSGPAFILRAWLEATRDEFLSLTGLIPVHEQQDRPVCGVWTLKDLLGHLADWEGVGVLALRQLVDGVLPELDPIDPDFDKVNQVWARARQEQSLEKVWQHFTRTRRQLLRYLDALSDSSLARPFVAPWGTPTTGYRMTAIWAFHASEHALDLRQALGLRRLPPYLRHS